MGVILDGSVLVEPERRAPIGAHDLQLAATALSLDSRLATSNPREFLRVPGLIVENWMDPPD